jgi:hypothetical protein
MTYRGPGAPEQTRRQTRHQGVVARYDALVGIGTIAMKGVSE